MIKRILYNAIVASILETTKADPTDEPCKLFSVECSVDTGFTITINEACKAEQYKHLGPENKGLFVWGKDLEDENNPDPKKEDIAENCKFIGNTVTVGFQECGEAGHTDGDDSTVWKTFVHHRANIGPIIASSMDQAPIECKMDHVDLSVNPMGVAPNDELLGLYDIGSEEMIEEFKLELKAGQVANGNFAPFVDGYKVDVGRMVRIRLYYRDDAKYSFVLRDCKATASSDTVKHELQFYDDYCPAEGTGILGVKWGDLRQFDFNAFRVGDTDDLVITCKVPVFPEAEDLSKYECTNKIGRKRRAIAAIRETEMTINLRTARQADETESVTSQGEVSVDIGISGSIEDMDERIIMDADGKPLTIFVAKDEDKEDKVEPTLPTVTASSSRICANVGLFFMILRI